MLSAIDLFCGAGGTASGLRNAGIETTVAVELDPKSANTFRLNHPAAHVFECDVRDVDCELLDPFFSNHPPDTLTACPPCQGFSTLGHTDHDDPRNDLVAEVWRFAKAMAPRSIILENVPGLRTDRRFDRLVRQLRGVGYRVWHDILDASEFKVPQFRKRLVMIAVRDLPSQVAMDPRERVDEAYRGTITVEQAFEVLSSRSADPDPTDVGRRHTPSVTRRIRSIPVGGNRFDLPARLSLDCHKRLVGRSATGPYARLKLTAPAPTMTTRCTTPSCGPFVHPTEHRGITLREAAVLQSFPVDYRFSGTYGSIERQIGNAVPVGLATAIGSVVVALLDEVSL